MSRFRPLRNRRVGREPLVQKGSSAALEVDRDEIERLIAQLRQHHSMRLKGAPEDLQTQVKKLRDWAERFSGFETYDDFYRIIIKHFGDLDEIQPGTIGAFCFGCQIGKSLPNPSTRACSATCLGSIPAPDMPHWINCECNVFLLSQEKDGSHHWKTLQTVSKSRVAYIFLLGDLQGEIKTEELEARGIVRYYLYQYRNGTYKELPSQRISTLKGPSGSDRQVRDDVIHRIEQIRKKRQRNHLKVVFFAILIIVLIIVALLFFITRRRKA